MTYRGVGELWVSDMIADVKKSATIKLSISVSAITICIEQYDRSLRDNNNYKRSLISNVVIRIIYL